MEFQVVILRFGKFGAGKFFEKKKCFKPLQLKKVSDL